MLSLLGIHLNPPSTNLKQLSFTSGKWLTILKLMKKLYYFLLTIICVGEICLCFGLTFYACDFITKIIFIAMMFRFVSVCSMFILVKRNSHMTVETLYTTVQHLNRKDVKFLQNHDKRHVLLRHLLTTVPAMVGAISFFVSKRTINFFGSIFFQSNWEMLLHSFAFLVSYFSVTWIGHFYWAVQTVAKTYANYCKDKIHEIHKEGCSIRSANRNLSASQIDYIRKILNRHFIFLREINGTLGVVPLVLFSSLFANIVITVSFIVLFNQAKVVAIVVLGVAGGNQLIQVVQVIIISSQTTNIIEKAVVLSEELTTTPLPTNASLSLRESRRCLTVFLQSLRIQSMVPFSAQSTFNLEPSVVLSFFNAVVPFTVMFITTIAQINRENKPLNSNNTDVFVKS